MFATRILSLLAVLDGASPLAPQGPQAHRGPVGPQDYDGAKAAWTGLGETSGAPARWRRETHAEHRQHEASLDANYLHLPLSALEHFPDALQGCEAMKNASMLRQVLELPVMLEPPCPVTLKPLLDTQRVWPAQLYVAECACPSTSCKPRTAYVCTQVYSPVVMVTVDELGHFHHNRRLIATGCRCMTARATMAPELDEDYK